MKTFTRDEWVQLRSKGHTRFVLFYGLVRSGIPFAVIMSAILFLWSLLDHSAWSPGRAAFKFVIFVLLYGYVMGEWQWRRGERDYHDTVA